MLLQIVESELPDEEVNRLVWEALGYTKTIDLDPETLTAQEVSCTHRLSVLLFLPWSCHGRSLRT